MTLENDREIFDIAEETEHVTFQKTSRKTNSDYDLPMFMIVLLLHLKNLLDDIM